MAIYVVYRKFRETETDVEYHYGGSEEDLNERVVIDKRDPNGPPKECSSHLGRQVIGRVMYERTDDEWPAIGAIQS